MEKSPARKMRFINFVLILMTVAGLSGAAFGATFTVTKTADTNDGMCNADCSLREAIAAANAVSTDDVINFDAGVFSTAQTITLANTELVIGAIDYQPTPVTESLTINGTGANLLTISGNNASRVFAIYRVISTIRGISVTGGNGDGSDINYDGRGGAIFSAGGIFNLLDSVVKDNSTQQGGGIYLFGTCNLTNVTISNNISTNGGTSGGGIHSFGALTLLNSTVSNNLAHGIGGGIKSDSNLTLTNTAVTSNTSYSQGGGVHQSGGAFNTYTDSNISNNIAATGGGGLRISSPRTVFTNSIVSNNTAETGGGVFSHSTPGFSGQGRFIFNSSIIRENRAVSVGGGIYTVSGSDFEYRFDNSTISGNTAGGTTFQDGGGGGVYNSYAAMFFNNTTISNNTAIFNGGGISSYGFLTFTNSTVSGNSANNGGGIYSYNRATTTTAQTVLTNTTIAKNIAGGNGGGITNIAGFPNFVSAILQAKNSIIADNAASTGNDFFGAFVSQGYNLIENTGATTGTTATDITGVDPQLFPLGNYGGATRTHALSPTSPAIDKGNSFGAITDQRGQIRPFDNPLIPNSPSGDAADIGSFERQATETPLKTAFDFDGDGKADISVFRSSNSVWYLQQSSNGFTSSQFGISTDKIVPADYDGDGKTDVAVYRNGTWYLQRSQAGFAGIAFGESNDIPVPADFDGDGKADISVFRPSNGVWYRLNSSNNQFVAVVFGVSDDKPVIGDFDGDGKADITVFRPSTGSWYRLNSSNSLFVAVNFGIAEDKPVPADYDGDGKSDIAVYRPSSGIWYRLNSSNNAFGGTAFGTTNDLPTAADYDGDGKADVAVFRPSNGVWYQLRSASGFSAQAFGTNGDIPTPNFNVR